MYWVFVDLRWVERRIFVVFFDMFFEERCFLRVFILLEVGSCWWLLDVCFLVGLIVGRCGLEVKLDCSLVIVVGGGIMFALVILGIWLIKLFFRGLFFLDICWFSWKGGRYKYFFFFKVELGYRIVLLGDLVDNW